MNMRKLVEGDLEKARLYGVDPNPFSTDGARHLWQLGFDGKPLPEINAVGSPNWRVWERGRLAREIQDQAKGSN